MGVEDRIAAIRSAPTADEVAYSPRTEFDGVTGFIQTGPMPEPPASHTELLKEFGYNPDEVRIVGHPKVSKWQQRSRVRGTNTYETVWLSAYKFTIASVSRVKVADLDAIVKRARKQPRTGSGPHWMVFQASDLQIGKKSRDGSTTEILQRYFESLTAMVAEHKQLRRHGVEGIQVSMPGDCIEGWVSQGGRNVWLTEGTVAEQVRILRRVIMHTVEAVAPLVDQVFIDVVGGNHDDTGRAMNTYPGDNWAVEAATAVHDALALNPSSYGHVTVRIPDKWSASMTVPVGDTVVTVIHGHQWRRGQAMKWWSEQALHQQPAGASHVLQHGHYHSWQVETTERRTRIQSSTFDCGSDWFRNTHGAVSRRGGLVYLLRGGEVSRMSLV